MSLTFQGNADEAELEDGAAHVFDDAEEDSLDDPTLGLRYIFQENDGYHGSLFRQSVRADWRASRQDTQGVRYTLKSAFVQRLSNEASLSYEWSSRYTTRPRESWVAHILSTRYRRNVWRDWVFVEVSPYIAFEKKYDWHPNPGIRMSLDILFTQNQPHAIVDD